EKLELVISVVVSVFSAQRNLLDYLPSLGHIPRVVNYLPSTSLPVTRAATLSTHQFTFSKVCSSVLECTEVVSGLVSAMKIRPDLVGVACEALHNLFSGSGLSASSLVDQGIRANVVPFLLSLLENPRLQVSNPASTKAQIVTCLKTMAASPQHSDEVSHVGNYYMTFLFRFNIAPLMPFFFPSILFDFLLLITFIIIM
ncbi:UNVERIFIED_CONTAM: hypothetical protein GTU68_046190, partial [Idotea baltica]|nr:hypothetical protein [Idotea baltica]